MQSSEQEAILTIAMLAAFADGAKDDREREEIRRIAQSLSDTAHAPRLIGLYQDVLLGRASVADASAALTQPAHRQLAYETAVCVCDADGAASSAELEFLRSLRSTLGLDTAQTLEVEREAEALATLPVTVPMPGTTGGAVALPTTTTGAGLGAATPSSGARESVPANMSDAEMDKTILNASILNGALELLPQSWASMAIIPLQMRLVYRIGQAHGVELDQGHIKEFLATAGVGLSSQYLEQVGRKLLGGLLGGLAGGLGRAVGRGATGVAFSFATTYALGHLARRYYAGGRQMNTAILQETYQSLLGSAREMQGQYLPQIQQRASTLDVGQIASLVKQS
jgi:uncharacterized protein (DUF697 family)/tellurite resistance protein